MSVGTTLSRVSTVSASTQPMPGISQPEIRAADRENEPPVPRPPVANGGRTHAGSQVSVPPGTFPAAASACSLPAEPVSPSATGVSCSSAAAVRGPVVAVWSSAVCSFAARWVCSSAPGVSCSSAVAVGGVVVAVWFSAVCSAMAVSRAVSASGPVRMGMPRVTWVVTCTLVSSRSIRASARAWSRVRSGSLRAYWSPRSRMAAQAAAERAAGRRAHQSVLPSGPGETCTRRSLRLVVWAAATWSAAMRVATRRATVVIRAGSIPVRRGSSTASTAAQAGSSRPSQAVMTLPALTGGQVAGEHQGQQPREAGGQLCGEADLAGGGPLPDPGGQGHLRGRHRVDEPDVVLHVDRAALGQPDLQRGGVRDRDQLRPFCRVDRRLAAHH